MKYLSTAASVSCQKSVLNANFNCRNIETDQRVQTYTAIQPLTESLKVMRFKNSTWFKWFGIAISWIWCRKTL